MAGEHKDKTLWASWLLALMYGLVFCFPAFCDGAKAGDVDGDGRLTAADALSALRMSVSISPSSSQADMDGEGGVTSNDARLILLCAVGDCPGETAQEPTEVRRCRELLDKAEAAADARRWDEVLALCEEAAAFVKTPACSAGRFQELLQLAQDGRADCDRRLALAIKGAGQCKKKDWTECAGTLEGILDGANCQGDAAKALEKARDLLAVARDEMEKQRQAEAAAALEKERLENAEAETKAKNARCSELWKHAHLKSEKKDHAGAVSGYRKVLELCPDNCGAMNNIGLALEQLGRKEEALDWFEKAVACAPDNAAYKNDRKDMKQKIADNERRKNSAASPGKDCDMLFKAAVGKHKAGDFAGAEKGYLAVLQVCPGECSVMNNLGFLATQRDHMQDALEWYQKAASCNPKRYKEFLEKFKAKITKTDQTGQRQTQATSSPTASSGGYAGVYDGRADDGGYWGRAVRIRLTIKGNDVFLDFPDGELKRRQGSTAPQGSVDAEGNIRIKLSDRHQWKGRISGRTASGTWVMDLPDVGPMFPKGVFKDTWTATKVR